MHAVINHIVREARSQHSGQSESKQAKGFGESLEETEAAGSVGMGGNDLQI